MENSFTSLITSANEILILLPNKPFLDQVSGALSLYLSLNASGKKAVIACSAPMTAEFSRLVGVDKIASDIGSKNLDISLVNYDANSVDKVSYDINNGQFKLTISPKSGFNSPTVEQVKVDYSGVSGDLVILMGGANDSHFPETKREELQKTKMVHIGTRLLEITSSDLSVLSYARPASSTSEIVASLIKESALVVDQDIATNLLIGIEEQSKGFQSSEVTAETFEIVAELLKLGGKRMPKIIPAKNYPNGSIPNKPFAQVQTISKTPEPIFAEASKGKQMTPEEAEMELNQEIPAAWSEPKIFTGTSLS
ncbi:MAG: hypothetical protein QY322_02760 [bacterium]|nr:MAG: hypothetical protein QY322_02760 [bacterium]